MHTITSSGRSMRFTMSVHASMKGDGGECSVWSRHDNFQRVLSWITSPRRIVGEAQECIVSLNFGLKSFATSSLAEHLMSEIGRVRTDRGRHR